jgi:hypothetical protein
MPLRMILDSGAVRPEDAALDPDDLVGPDAEGDLVVIPVPGV